jgi:predicted nucleic acid-binding protein
MSDEGVLVDTSVWVEYLRRPSSSAGRTLDTLLSEDRVMITGPVVAEILHGAKNTGEKEDLSDALSGIPAIELEFKDWLEIGSLLNEQRLKGLNFALVDIAIAHAARKSSCSLYTLDAAHRRLAGLTFFTP